VPGPRDAALDPGDTLERLARAALGLDAGKALWVLLPSAAHLQAARAGTAGLAAPRHLCFVGEPLADATVERWRALAPETKRWKIDLHEGLPFAAGPLGRPARSGLHPLGAPIDGIALCVEDAEGEPVAPGKAGILVLVHPERGRIVTGEHARRLASGRIEPLVTDGDAALVALEVGEIEAALLALPGVEGAAVVRPLGEPEGTVTLTAFVAGQLDAAAWRAAQADLLRDELAAMPVITLDALPLRADGRVDRARLRASAAMAADARRDLVAETRALVGPRTATEATVAALWQRLLGTSVGVDDDFFLAGGQSLLAAQLAARLSAQLGIDMPLSVFFEHTTIAGQAAWLDRAPQERAAAPRSPSPEGAPLSITQERYWFFEQMSPGTTVQHLQWMFELTGPLDEALLERAMRAIARRHEALRTVFRQGPEGPTQHVLATLPRWHEAHDLRALGPAALDAAFHHAAAEFRRPFDLERGPPFRTFLFALGDQRALLCVHMHHIIGDAWALNLWMRELGELYAAGLAGREAQLPALGTQPADLARAERRALAAGALDPQLAYFRKALADLPAGLDLPADRPRPAQPGYRGVFVPFEVPREIADRLRALARQRGATFFMALLAALDLLLARVSGQTDLVVGTPVAGRDREATRNLIGLFLNNVPLRVDASGDPSFLTLLDRCRDAARAALGNAALPFERLLAEIPTPRGSGRHPLFDVMLNLVPEAADLVLPGLTVTPYPGENDSSPIDLLVTFRELPDGSLLGNLRASADLFDLATADRLTRRLTRALAVAGAEPERPLSRISLLDERERRDALETWNATACPVPDAPLAALIEQAVDLHPDAPAVIFGDERLGLRALDRRANRIASALLARGLPREARVAVYLRRSLDLPAALLGILKAGGAFVLLDPDLPAARTDAMLEAAAPFALLSHGPLAARLPAALHARTLWLDDPATLAAASDERPARHAAPDDLAYLMFTSGSTGTPKGVLVPQRGLSNRIEWVRHLFPFVEGELVCQKTPLGFIDALWELLGPLRDGIPVLLPSDETALDPARLADLLDRAGVTRIMLVPSLLRALLHVPRGPRPFLPRLGLWLVGGEELGPELARELLRARPDARLVNLYGLSEVSGEATWYALREPLPARIPIGRAGPNVRAYVLDQAGEPALPGTWGELYLGGAGVARGYLDDAAQRSPRFLADPFSPGGRMFRTGDRARQREDGSLDYAGRLDQQLKIRGVRIDPGEIEEALRRAPGVADAAVTARPGPDGELRLAGYFVPVSLDRAHDPASIPRPPALRWHLRRLLPEPMVPALLVRLDALPLSPNGKVDHEALPAPVEAPADEARAKTPTEEALATLWDELLHSGPYGADDDFFARGGYSLLLGRLALRVRATFDVDLPLAALFQAPQLGEQARLIDETARHRRHAPRLDRIPRVPRVPQMPLSFPQERMWLGETLKFDALPHLIVLALHLQGPLDLDRLEQAMDALIARHEPLRTTFAAELGVPFQTVHDALPRRHARVDLRPLAPAARDAEIARRQAQEYRTPFDLVRGPPFRSTLVQLAEGEHLLFVSMSHLVSDGASVLRWLDELAALYAAPSLAAADLPALAVQAVDLAVWSRRALAQGELDADRAYFKALLAAAPAPRPLPADGVRSPTDPGGWVGARLPSTTLLRLRERARTASVTLFSLLLAALGRLIGELTGEPLVTLGTLSSGRDLPESQPLLGLFLNTIPLRFAVPSDAGELLQSAHTASMQALSHAAVPFERIVADVAAPRERGRNPLFDVVLNHVPRQPDYRLGEARVDALDPPALLPMPFDLMWRVFERRDGLQLALEYRRNLFTEPRARTWLDRYVALLVELAG
jgi:amino acid adenylation domain-containing protein